MLMGAVANMAPDAFGGIVAEVPFVDVLTTMLDETLPLTPPEWPEWGNPIASEDDYRTIAAYSPYDNVARARLSADPGASPASPIRASPIGSRPNGWRGCATARRGDNPVLFKINMDAGHAGASGRFSRLEEIAFTYAFALKVMGKLAELAQKCHLETRNCELIFRSQLRWPRATQCAASCSRDTPFAQGSAMLLVDVYLDKSPIQGIGVFAKNHIARAR